MLIDVDKKLLKYGYAKTDESQYGVYYKSQETPPSGHTYTHTIAVLHKHNGLPIIQTYNTYLEESGGWKGEAGWIEAPVVLLIWIKYLQMVRKYKWNRVSENVH